MSINETYKQLLELIPFCSDDQQYLFSKALILCWWGAVNYILMWRKIVLTPLLTDRIDFRLIPEFVRFKVAAFEPLARGRVKRKYYSVRLIKHILFTYKSNMYNAICLFGIVEKFEDPFCSFSPKVICWCYLKVTDVSKSQSDPANI
jgi:hypothetical protein